MWSGDPWPSSLPVPVGGDLDLTCDACAQPEGDITWFINDKVITDASGPSLSIPHISWEQFGIY